MTRYVLGMDGGGTKTDVLICTVDGQVTGQFTGSASSISGQSIEHALENLGAILQKALRSCGLSSHQIAGYYAGISGAGLPQNQQMFQQFFDEFFPGVPGRAGSDAANALAAGIGLRDGCIAIAGTGSCVQYRTNGIMKRIGGWGYLLGDEGSGYDLGKRAITVPLQTEDGRMQPCRLSALCREQMQLSLEHFTAWLYRQDAKQVISGYAPLLMRAAAENDPVAVQHMQEATAEMAHAIKTAAKAAQSPWVVLGGSLWKNHLYRFFVRQHLPDHISFVIPQTAPVYGAAVLAGQAVSEKASQDLFEALCKHSDTAQEGILC